jgi:glycosyltransferase involved in cell wall biosynthesis
MRVLFLSDAAFTTHEQVMLSRLAIGLADEGTRVAWGVSAEQAEGMTESVLAPIVPYQLPRLGVSTKRSAGDLVDRVVSVLGDAPDILHMFGGGVLRVGAEASRMFSAVPAFEVWRPNTEAAVRIAAYRARGMTHSSGEQGPAPLFTVPTESISSKLTQSFPDGVVRLIPWGVHASGVPKEPDDGTVTIIVLGPGRDGRSWQAAFKAALRVLKGNESAHVFADAGAVRRHKMWGVARQAGLLDRVSLMDNADVRRDLALRADIMLYPDARGECRTILLDAMANGVTIIAATDPLADSLIDGETARLVTDPTEAQWHEALAQMIGDRSARETLVSSSAAYVQEHHRATRQIISLIDAYEWVAGNPVRLGADEPLG